MEPTSAGIAALLRKLSDLFKSNRGNITYQCCQQFGVRQRGHILRLGPYPCRPKLATGRTGLARGGAGRTCRTGGFWAPHIFL